MSRRRAGTTATSTGPRSTCCWRRSPGRWIRRDRRAGLPGGDLLSGGRDRPPGGQPHRYAPGDAEVATMTIDLAADLDQDGHVTPAGTLTAAVALPGDWGTAAPPSPSTRPELDVVTPDGGGVDPIRSPPTVDGLGALVAGATQLLAELAAATVVWLTSGARTHDVPTSCPRWRPASVIYVDDAVGVTDPAGGTARRRQPGWPSTRWPTRARSSTRSSACSGRRRKTTLPADHTISRDGDRLRWGCRCRPGARSTRSSGGCRRRTPGGRLGDGSRHRARHDQRSPLAPRRA